MVRLLRWLLGFVSFKFEGGFADGFVNSCFENKISVNNIRRSGNTVFAECYAGVYPRLKAPARANGGKLRVIKKRGILFPLLKVKNRLGLFSGAVGFVLILCFLSGFIWDVEIKGNERIPDSEIYALLEDNGLFCGAYRKGVDKDVIENLMMATFDDCAWAHINEFGTKAVVEINETKNKPKTYTRKGVANLKATKDGLIVKADVYDGWAVRKVGDSVTEGDLLISGVYESEKKKGNQFAYARGEYIAQVKEEFTVFVSRIQRSKSYTYTQHKKSLYFFGLKIPLYIGRLDNKNTDINIYTDYITIKSNKIPIGIIDTELKHYVVSENTLSDKELTALCKSEIKNRIKTDLAHAQVLSQKSDIDLRDNGAKAKCTVLCLENIGRSVKIKVNRKK